MAYFWQPSKINLPISKWYNDTAFQIHTFGINDVACLSFQSLKVLESTHSGMLTKCLHVTNAGIITIDLCKNLAVADHEAFEKAAFPAYSTKMPNLERCHFWTIVNVPYCLEYFSTVP